MDSPLFIIHQLYLPSSCLSSSPREEPITVYYAKPHLLPHKLQLRILISRPLSPGVIFQAPFQPDVNAGIEYGTLCHRYLDLQSLIQFLLCVAQKCLSVER